MRRFPTRIYVGLPTDEDRKIMLERLLEKAGISYAGWNLDVIVTKTDR
jgi:hypothetical protein